MQLIPRNEDVVWEPIPNSSQQFALDTRCHHTLYTGARGPGKCLPLDTPVPTPAGWRKHGDLREGDSVFGGNGSVVTVLEAFAPESRETFALFFNDGTSLSASDNHLWSVSYDRGTQRSWRVATTREIADRVAKGYPVRLPSRPVVDYPATALAIDAYILGAWVGDGSTSVRVRQPTGNRTKPRAGYSIEFGSQDSELVDAFIASGFTVKRHSADFTWLSGTAAHRDTLRSLGLWETKSATKFIPDAILLNDRNTRLAFLQGLADTDGTPRKATGARISTVSQKLANGVVSLVQSLGGVARCGSYTPQEKHRQKLTIFNIDFSLPSDIPFRLTRKIARYNAPQRFGWFCPAVVAVQLLGEQLVSCIAVAADDSLYVAGAGYTVTHNTDTQLMRFRRRVGIGYGSYWRGVIFDREYKNLDDLVSKSKRWFNRFNDGAKFLEAAKDYKWVWPTGEELLFRVAKKENDYWNFHGQEFPFIGWNELTKYPSGKLYDDMMSTNRSSFLPEKDTPRRYNAIGKATGYNTPDMLPLPEIPLEVFSTTNPYGPGHGWVKRRFIDPAPYGVVVNKTTRVFNPRTQKDEDIVRKQVAIFGSYRENIYLSPEYVAELNNIKDPNKRRAWVMGDWDIVAGGAFDDVWDRRKHILPRFKIPEGWHVDRAFDWGSTHPFSVGWFAESNGEEVILPDGTRFCPPAGTIIQIYEWYGTEELGTNKGLTMSAGDIAKGIIKIEDKLISEGWITGRPWPGPADNQISNVREKDVETIETKMERHGVNWVESDKSAGSRKIGLQLIRDRLESSIRQEGQGIYFMSCCTASVTMLPVLPRDEDNLDDVDTEAEDHFYDMIRYRVLRGSSRMAKTIKIEYAS